MEPSYQDTFTGAKKYVLRTFATTQSALMKKRVAQYMTSADCPLCTGNRLRRESLSVKFAGFDFADISRLPLKRVRALYAPSQTARPNQTPGKSGSIRKKTSSSSVSLSI